MPKSVTRSQALGSSVFKKRQGVARARTALQPQWISHRRRLVLSSFDQKTGALPSQPEGAAVVGISHATCHLGQIDGMS